MAILWQQQWKKFKAHITKRYKEKVQKIQMLSSLQALNRKATRPKGVANDAFARSPNLSPTLCDLELLHRRRYNIIGIYHNICLPGLVEIRQTVLGIFHRKFFDTHFDPEWPLPSNCRPPKFIISCPRPTDDSCAKWYQKWCMPFQHT